MGIDLNNISETIKRLNPHLFPDFSGANGNCNEKLSKEKELHNFIIKICKENKYIYFHGSTAHKTYRTLGEPDFTLLLPDGKLLLIECKTPKGKLSIEQLGMIKWAKQLGHKIHVIRSKKQFLDLLNETLKNDKNGKN